MADLKIDEEKLLARLDSAALMSQQLIDHAVAEAKREVSEAAQALRDLPSSFVASLPGALAVASVTVAPTEWESIGPSSVGLTIDNLHFKATQVQRRKGQALRFLVIAMPVEEGK